MEEERLVDLAQVRSEKDISGAGAGGLPYVDRVVALPSGSASITRLLDWDGNEVGRCRKAGGVKEPLQSARRLLETLHKQGKLAPQYHDEEAEDDAT